MVKIPLNIEPNQSLKVVLAGQNCEIKLYYRFGAMFMDLICNNVLIQSGAICTNRGAVINKATNDFVGQLYFVDLLGDTSPVFTGFADRYSLLYVGDNEVTPAGLLP